MSIQEALALILAATILLDRLTGLRKENRLGRREDRHTRPPDLLYEPPEPQGREGRRRRRRNGRRPRTPG
jgi:hypothetical protein